MNPIFGGIGGLPELAIGRPGSRKTTRNMARKPLPRRAQKEHKIGRPGSRKTTRKLPGNPCQVVHGSDIHITISAIVQGSDTTKKQSDSARYDPLHFGTIVHGSDAIKMMAPRKHWDLSNESNFWWNRGPARARDRSTRKPENPPGK